MDIAESYEYFAEIRHVLTDQEASQFYGSGELPSDDDIRARLEDWEEDR